MRSYSLKTMLTILLASGLAFLIAGEMRERAYQSRWANATKRLEQWSAGLTRTAGNPEHFIYLNEDLLVGIRSQGEYTVLTTEAYKYHFSNSRYEWRFNADSPIDPSRFFVIPPGIWVENVEDIARIWDDHRDQEER
ncbi:MAG: hypothetical protein AAF745_18865 [Planctomycetota bacterium]